MSKNGLRSARIRFDLEVDDGFPPISSEFLHGKIISDGAIQVDNTPFFVEGIAVGDIVNCRVSANQNTFEFEHVVKHSGNKSISVIFIDGAAEPIVREEMKKMKLYYEYAKFPEYDMMAISVENEADFDRLTEFLSDFQRHGKISYAELCV